MALESVKAMQENESGVAKRRPLRLILSVSAVTGLIFNIITIAVNARLRWHAPLILDSWVFLPVSVPTRTGLPRRLPLSRIGD